MASGRVESPSVEPLPDELLAKLTELAKKKGLSRASYIRMVLTEHVSEQDREEAVSGS